MRVLKNKCERSFQVWAEQQKWTITKRGWPDFFCRNQRGELVLVEVKKGNRKLKNHQQDVLTELAKYGIPCYRWSPDGGFRKIE
jgi:hypothetical protein